MFESTHETKKILDNLVEEIRAKQPDLAKIHILITEAKSKSIDLNEYANKYKYGTLLHFAVLKCRGDSNQDINTMLEIINLLCKAGVEVNKNGDDSGKYFPLHIAARRALPEVVTCLIQNGANLNVTDSKGKTPLDLVNQAISEKETEIGRSVEKEVEAGHSEEKEYDPTVLTRLKTVRNLLQQRPENFCRIT